MSKRLFVVAVARSVLTGSSRAVSSQMPAGPSEALEGMGTFIVRAGRAYELLATAKLGELVMATPAISGSLIFRTDRSVIAIGRQTS